MRLAERLEALFPLIVHVDQALLEHRDVFVNGKTTFVFNEEDRLQDQVLWYQSCGIYTILTVLKLIVTLT